MKCRHTRRVHMSHVMRKPAYAICDQQRRRSASASAQSDQHLFVRCLDNISLRFYLRNFKPLPSFCGCTGRFEPILVAKPEDRFSRDEAHIQQGKSCTVSSQSEREREYSDYGLFLPFLFFPSLDFNPFTPGGLPV